jgi:hypothetical protein
MGQGLLVRGRIRRSGRWRTVGPWLRWRRQPCSCTNLASLNGVCGRACIPIHFCSFRRRS